MWNALRFVRPLIVLALLGGSYRRRAGASSGPGQCPVPHEFTQIHMGLPVSSTYLPDFSLTIRQIFER
jgi:hypothetical protein